MKTFMPVNGTTLRWAREALNITPEELAQSIGIEPFRIYEFEEGATQPTLPQMIKVAKKLDRTPGFFFTPVPSEPDVPRTADFRGRNQHEKISAPLLREIKRAESYRQTIIELNGVPEQPLKVGTISRLNIIDRAQEARHLLGLADDFRPDCKQISKVFKFWRRTLEDHGILVFQTTSIGLQDFRGLSIYHDVYPLILVNGADAHNGKIFTLFHEFAHLANRISGLCILSEKITEEAICNSFAANFLMPVQEVFRRLVNVPNNKAVDVLAQEFKVSRLAAGVRLKTLEYITQEHLELLREQYDQDWNQDREERNRNNSSPPHWRIRYRDLGDRYIGTVAQAVEEERIDILDATYLLNARLSTVERLFAEYYRSGGIR